MLAPLWKATYSAGFLPCLRSAFFLQMPPNVAVASANKVTFPKYGKYTSAYRIVYETPVANGKPVVGVYDLIAIGNERTQIVLVFKAGLGVGRTGGREPEGARGRPRRRSPTSPRSARSASGRYGFAGQKPESRRSRGPPASMPLSANRQTIATSEETASGGTPWTAAFRTAHESTSSTTIAPEQSACTPFAPPARVEVVAEGDERGDRRERESREERVGGEAVRPLQSRRRPRSTTNSAGRTRRPIDA